MDMPLALQDVTVCGWGSESVCSADVLSYCFVAASEQSCHQRLQGLAGMHCFTW